MRFLLISDTHGKLRIINETAKRLNADAVIHAGDFGFYCHESYSRLSERELRLLIIHSDLEPHERDRLLTLSVSAKVEAAIEHGLAGEFQDFIDRTESFEMPVYAVWGNHEDKEVVERLYRGELVIKNLHVLHDNSHFTVNGTLLYGLGGNFLPSSKLLGKPIAGGGGRIWSTLSQYASLAKLIDEVEETNGRRIFVSHVSPGKEPFVEFIGARTGADFTVSGHMGAPTSMVWNSFAISTVEEAEHRLRLGFEGIRELCKNSERSEPVVTESALNLIGRLPEQKVHIGRGQKAPRWYRNMTNVNLPDACFGCGILDIEGDQTRLQCFVHPPNGIPEKIR